MSSVNKYDILETIYDSDHSTIYKIRNEKFGNEAILKQSKSQASSGLYNEYSLELEQSDDKSLVELTELSNKPAFLRQFYQGKTLRQEIDEKNHGMVFFFKICFKLVDALQHVHNKQIIHKDLSPENIVVDLHKEEVHIIDFEIGTGQQSQHTNYKGASVIEGNLSYIAPEQTGRMNRLVDYRSDYYSLGAIFYEILSGQKPFTSPNAFELIHCHITLLPTSLHEINKEIPEALAAVVSKLMAKNAEDRYQSLSGLLADLTYCKNEWISTGTIQNFELRKADLPVKLNVTQKLVGREKEIEQISSLYQQAEEDKKILLSLKGLSGLGKTMLIRETAKLLTGSQGTFITGKFDSLQRNVPYYGWTQALNQLAELLLTESTETISYCVNRLHDNMQGLEADIIAIAPRWKTVLGNVTALPQLNPKEQQSRVHFAFSLFFRTVLSVTKPLLLFIDDWQWADDASVELLRIIATDGKLHALFMAMAFRHNETDATHPFIRLLQEFESEKDLAPDSNLITASIELKKLEKKDIHEILKETFSSKQAPIEELGDLIYAKTQGNPFFINQLLDYLYSKKFIWLDEQQKDWRWNIAGIRELAINENIANVIINKINDISPQTLEILTFASCLGNHFSLASLHFITQIPEQTLHAQLWEAIKENILQPLDADYKFVPGYYEKHKINLRFHFTHDRIQQSLYALTQAAQREELHYKAAEFIISNDDEPENIFITANHLVSCGNLLHNASFQGKAAGILKEAGRSAFESGAYESSFVFLSLFEKLASPVKEVSIDDYYLLIQLAYLNKKDEAAKTYSDKSFAVAKNKTELSAIFEAILKGMIAMHKLHDAIAVARKGFVELDFKLPKQKASKLQVIIAAIKTQIAFPDKKISQITQFPKMTDEKSMALMRLINISLEAFFFVERDTYPLLIFKMIQMSTKYGNTAESIIGYGSYGLILAGIMNKTESGYAAGKEAMKLFESFDAVSLESAAGFVDTSMISHWKEPLLSFEQHCIKYYRRGLNTGNMEYAAWNLFTHASSIFFRGSKVSEMVELYDNYQKFYLRHRQLNAFSSSQLIRKSLQKLLNPSGISLQDDHEEQQSFESEKKANNAVFLFLYHTLKIYLGAFHLQYKEALNDARQNEKDIINAASMYWQPYFRAFKTSVYINCAFEGTIAYSDVKKELSKDRSSIIKANKLYEGNVGWILDLMNAEISAYEFKKVDHALYSSAIGKARKYGFEFPALFIELMRIQKMKYLNLEGSEKYFLQLKDKLAAVELHSVIYAWEKKYPEFRITEKRIAAETNAGGAFSSEQFDAKTIIKTTQALSAEIVLDKLIDKMMEFAMENAGARYGCFMVKKETDYEMVAQKFSDDLEKKKKHAHGIPVSIMNYVIHTNETLILDAASETAPYSSDPDIAAANEKSVMCVPIIHQHASIGMLYLTNSLSRSVFTEERVGLLKMLAGQMGVSLQNALLYDNMEKLVAKRTEQLAQEMQKTDRLLLNILPNDVAAELKESGKATPKYYEQATVLFCDIVNFTKQAEKMTAADLIAELDLCFKAFDNIIALHQLEKIKTIGDAYLCVGGVPRENPNHCLNVVKAAIDIQNWMNAVYYERHQLNKNFFKLRIGIHSGPIVAGVVGSSKFAYDIWGDTVNTACRMEQNSEPGRINVSESVYEIINQDIPCTFRGNIEAKNKGKLKMYFVN